MKEPIPGVYDWVVNFDLNSLYPHLIMQYNISPETLLEDRHPTVTVDEILNEEINLIIFDDNGNVGKRYRRQDEIGTPFCITVDFDTLENDTVTLRDRDTGQQERIKISELLGLLKSKILAQG